LTSFHRKKNENGGEPAATAQRPQLSRSVLTHVPRQPGSWLIWDVRQNMHRLILFSVLVLAGCSLATKPSRTDITQKEGVLCVGMPFAVAEAKLKAREAESTMFEVMLTPKEYRAGKELHFYCLRSGAYLEIVSAPGKTGRIVDSMAINTYSPKSYSSKMDPEYTKFHRSFMQCSEYDLGTEPNKALQHNDPSCHESCLRTPRASRGRG